ncbi:hypothetical protein BDZ89DRAFT_1086669, partial [Hymenopellis radicata]
MASPLGCFFADCSSGVLLQWSALPGCVSSGARLQAGHRLGCVFSLLARRALVGIFVGLIFAGDVFVSASSRTAWGASSRTAPLGCSSRVRLLWGASGHLLGSVPASRLR